jgi:GDP-mannose pyrophosphatase NudK
MQQSAVTIVAEELLSDNWYILKKVTFERTTGNGSAARQTREVYDACLRT